MVSRRTFLATTSAAGLWLGLDALLPAWARQASGLSPSALSPSAMSDKGRTFDLDIGKTPLRIDGKKARAITINGSIPGPLLRFREGEDVTINVHNSLDEDTSLHWHGILLPPGMDGVPHVSFPGIRPGETFTYRYKLKQSGTYWYHSHSGLQEQSGVYGPLIIDPKDPDPVISDREHVIFLSDWTFENPDKLFARLKKQPDYYNYQQRTMGDFFRDISKKGLGATLADRASWGHMRMDPTDISDVTAATYRYLMNGVTKDANWTGLFKPGERVRLRIINGSAMTYFNMRIPGLAMTVVAADGQAVEPVTVDEFQIGVAETYDVIVEPKDDRAYTVFAENIDRSGYVRGTLAPRMGMTAAVPAMRERPTLTMMDMAMDHGAHGAHGAMNHEMDPAIDHAGHGDMSAAPAHSGPQLPKSYASTGKTPPKLNRVGVDGIAAMPASRLHEPGTGLEHVDHTTLTYGDLCSLHGPFDERAPEREIVLHLTGNMERYMWSFDGMEFKEVKTPIRFHYGERLRLTMINNTMMNHPIHLHGMWMELDNGQGDRNPRKHTVNVKPGEKLSVNITADAAGDWAFHCHLLYHMKAGMFRVVTVADDHKETGA